MRKSIIIIAIIAIFVLGSVILHAGVYDLVINNVYSHNWSNSPVYVTLVSSYGTRNISSGDLHNLPSSTYTFENEHLNEGYYLFTASQDSRSISGSFYLHGQWGVVLGTLPGPYEPIPNNPPIQD